MMLKKDECTLSPHGTDRKSPASSPKLSIGAYHLRESHPKRQAKNNFRIEPFASLVRIWPFRLKHLMQLSLLQTCPSLRIITLVVNQSFGQSSNDFNNLFLLVAQCKTCKTHGFPHGKPTFREPAAFKVYHSFKGCQPPHRKGGSKKL